MANMPPVVPALTGADRASRRLDQAAPEEGLSESSANAQVIVARWITRNKIITVKWNIVGPIVRAGQIVDRELHGVFLKKVVEHCGIQRVLPMDHRRLVVATIGRKVG